MLEALSVTQIWLLIVGAAVIGFIAGRITASGPSEERARQKRMTQEAATKDFARLPPAAQAEVDRLSAEGKTIDAIKLIRKALDTGLYEAKQIVDQRKRLASARGRHT